jgi:hypothetical protein
LPWVVWLVINLMWAFGAFMFFAIGYAIYMADIGHNNEWS